MSVTDSTFWLGLTNSAASLFIVFMAPGLGAIADQGGMKKKFLFFFASVGIISTATLSILAEGMWSYAAWAFGFGLVGFTGANIFYDALIVEVSPPEKRDWLSSLGYSLGYLGGGILFTLNVLMTLNPHWFGLSSATMAIKISFVSVALWWGFFSIPLFRFVKEAPTHSYPLPRAFKKGIREVAQTFRRVRALPGTFLFLFSFWLYMDGVDTIIRMALDYGVSLGLESKHLISALLITQFVGFPSALAFGKVGTKFGAKNGILICIAIYLGVVFGAFHLTNEIQFYGLAAVVGLAQGGIQALSRSLYSTMIPAHRSGEFFGFYNMMGKFAAVIGPVLMGIVGKLTDSPRYSILSLAALLVTGGIILLTVDVQTAQKNAANYTD